MEYLFHIIWCWVHFYFCLNFVNIFAFFSFILFRVVCIYIHFHVLFLCSLSTQMDEETFNRGNGICFLCRFPTLSHEDAFFHGACWHVECLNNLGNGWMATLDPNALPFYLWLFNHWNGIVEFVMINGQLHLDWPSYSPLNDPIMELLDDSVSEGGEVILIVSDSEGNGAEVSANDDSIASDAPSTEIEDV